MGKSSRKARRRAREAALTSLVDELSAGAQQRRLEGPRGCERCASLKLQDVCRRLLIVSGTVNAPCDSRSAFVAALESDPGARHCLVELKESCDAVSLARGALCAACLCKTPEPLTAELLQARQEALRRLEEALRSQTRAPAVEERRCYRCVELAMQPVAERVGAIIINLGLVAATGAELALALESDDRSRHAFQELRTCLVRLRHASTDPCDACLFKVPRGPASDEERRERNDAIQSLAFELRGREQVKGATRVDACPKCAETGLDELLRKAEALVVNLGHSKRRGTELISALETETRARPVLHELQRIYSRLIVTVGRLCTACLDKLPRRTPAAGFRDPRQRVSQDPTLELRGGTWVQRWV